MLETYTVEGARRKELMWCSPDTLTNSKILIAAVPGLSQLYVCTDEDGKLYIATREQDQQTAGVYRETLWICRKCRSSEKRWKPIMRLRWKVMRI